MYKRYRQPVEAGTIEKIVDTVTGIVKKLFDTVFKAVDSVFTEKEYEKKDSKSYVNDNGDTVTETKYVNKHYVSGKGNEITVKCIYDKNNKTMTIEFSHDGGKDVETKKNVSTTISKSKFEDYITDYMDKHDLGSNEGETAVNQSTTMKVALTKVTSGTQVEVVLTKIVASDIVKAHSILDELVEYSDFVDSIPEGSTCCYEVGECEDGYQVEEIEPSDLEVQPCHLLVLCALSHASNVLKRIGWAVTGPNRNSLNMTLNDIGWGLSTYVDQFMAIYIGDNNYVPNIHDRETYDCHLIPYNVGIDTVVIELENLINVLEGYYPNFTSDEQAIIDQCLSMCKDKARRELPMIRE